MASFLNQVGSIASTFGTDTIFILGKGPSVDRIAPEVLANALVIGVNDAERIVPVDITLFHDDWVREALLDNGFRSRLYVCPMTIPPAHGSVVQARYEPMADGSDMMMQRLLRADPGSDFVIEEVLFISALRIARIVAQLRKRQQTVYMVGFDFTPDKGYPHAIGRDYSSGQSDLMATRRLCCTNPVMDRPTLFLDRPILRPL